MMTMSRLPVNPGHVLWQRIRVPGRSMSRERRDFPSVIGTVIDES